MCKKLQEGGFNKPGEFNGQPVRPVSHAGSGWPSVATKEEMIWIIEPVNLIKETLWKGTAIAGERGMTNAVATEDSVPTAIRSMKNAFMKYKYMAMTEIGNTLIKQTERVAERFDEAEDYMTQKNGYTKQNLGDKFKSFIKGEFSDVMGKLDTFFNTWDPKIRAVLDGTEESQDNADRAELRRRMEAMHDAIEATKGSWSNPFP